MGRHAGRPMAAIGDFCTTLPYFYSDLFDTRLEAVEDWCEPHRVGVVYYLDAGRVRGVLPWNVWEQVEAALHGRAAGAIRFGSVAWALATRLSAGCRGCYSTRQNTAFR